jgi:hypothetical protein
MSNLNARSGNPVMSIAQVADYILTVGAEQSVLLTGEPGIGKTSVVVAMAQSVGDKWRKRGDYFPEDKYDYQILTAPSLDAAAFGMFMPDVENRTVDMFVSGILNLKDPRPKVLMIDEIAKGPNVLRPVFRDLFLERCVHNQHLPAGSIVVATSNNASDGLGDVIKAHEGSAITTITVGKPSVKEWVHWARQNGVSPTTMTVAIMTPAMFQSYMTDNVSSNSMVFDPVKRQTAFVTGRTLYKNDRAHIKNRHRLSEPMLYAGMVGTIGQAAADVFMSFMAVEKEIPLPSEILSNPSGCRVPSSVGAKLFVIFNSVKGIETQADLAGYMTYVERFGNGVMEGVFASTVESSPDIKNFFYRNPKIAEWLKKEENFDMFGDF